MTKHYCDGCGVEVDDDNGVLGTKELTIELNDRKVSVAFSVGTLSRGDWTSEDNPAVCSVCLAAAFDDWSKMK